MHCEAQEAEGTQRPSVTWRRRDGQALQKSRVRALGGNITIDTLRRQDFGIYQCVASNEVPAYILYVTHNYNKNNKTIKETYKNIHTYM